MKNNNMKILLLFINKMIIVTGASENHRLSLINLIRSFFIHCNKELDTIIVYDLGINPEKWIEIQTQFASHKNIIYNKPPPYVKIKYFTHFCYFSVFYLKKINCFMIYFKLF